MLEYITGLEIEEKHYPPYFTLEKMKGRKFQWSEKRKVKAPKYRLNFVLFLYIFYLYYSALLNVKSNYLNLKLKNNRDKLSFMTSFLGVKCLIQSYQPVC